MEEVAHHPVNFVGSLFARACCSCGWQHPRRRWWVRAQWILYDYLDHHPDWADHALGVSDHG